MKKEIPMSKIDARLQNPLARRTFLRRMAGAAGGLAVTAVAAACGANKTEVSASAGATTGAPASAAAATTAAGATTAAASGTSAASATTAKAAATTPVTAPTPAAVAGTGFDATKEVVVSFSYMADAAAMGNMPQGGGGKGGGRILNPYVAVWVENAAGAAVRTISVNYQLGKGDRWLNELQRWFRVGKAGVPALAAVSSATRVPGDYKVVWDGTDDAKKPVAQGDYFVCIESAREHGPYSLIRETVTIGAAPAVKQLAAKGELQKASVELRARS